MRRFICLHCVSIHMESERVDITLPKGLKQEAKRYGINISFEATQAVKMAILANKSRFGVKNE